jgi:glycine/D-amino acid oxidase-like deaminating enzyme
MNAPAISRTLPDHLDIETDVLVIGAGACGLVASLAAHDGGAGVVVVERDDSPSGSTSMSSGFIPAPGTRAQRAAGIAMTPPPALKRTFRPRRKAGRSPSWRNWRRPKSGRRSTGWRSATGSSGSC